MLLGSKDNEGVSGQSRFSALTGAAAKPHYKAEEVVQRKRLFRHKTRSTAGAEGKKLGRFTFKRRDWWKIGKKLRGITPLKH